MSNKVVSWLAEAQSSLDNDAIPWFSIIQTLLAVVLSFEVLVSLRQLRTFHKETPPSALKQHVTQETFDKSRAYGREKLRFSIVSLVYEWALSAALIWMCAYARVWSAAGVLLSKFGFTHSGEVRFLDHGVTVLIA